MPARRKQRTVISLEDCDKDAIYRDTAEDITEHVHNFYRQLSGRAQLSMPEWIWKKWVSDDWEESEHLNATLIREVLCTMSKGKIAAEDKVVVEMLQQAPDEALHALALTFWKRILNNGDEEDEAVWDIAVTNLINKVARPKTIKQFRPITIIAVLAKVYSKCILTLAAPNMQQLANVQFAFRPKHQPHEVIYTLRPLVEKALEWNIHIWTTDGDILKA